MHRERKQSMVSQVFERLSDNKAAVAGITILIVILAASFIVPLFCQYGYNDMDPPSRYSAPSLEHWFGTDAYGRDIFVRIIYGARFSLALGLLSALCGLLVGIVLGCIDGFIGGTFDTVFMRFIDIWASIPGMLLAIIISTVLGPGFFNTVLALSIGSVPNIVRLLRGQILSVRHEEYLEAAESINCSPARIMFRHMLPNVIAPAIVSTTMNVGSVIVSAASLSYLNLGVQPPMPEWGAMLSEGRDYFETYPWLMIFPGIAIMIVVLSVNLFGDGLRDAIDPKLKR